MLFFYRKRKDKCNYLENCGRRGTAVCTQMFLREATRSTHRRPATFSFSDKSQLFARLLQKQWRRTTGPTRANDCGQKIGENETLPVYTVSHTCKTRPLPQVDWQSRLCVKPPVYVRNAATWGPSAPSSGCVCRQPLPVNR